MRKLTTEQLLSILKKYNFKELHVHHTWKPTHLTFTGSNHTDMNMAMRRYHVNVNGWSDIAQHLTLFPDGVFMTGRAFDRAPASISGRNGSRYKPLMVEMIGNFDFSGTGSYNNYGHDKLEGEQRKSIVALVKRFIETKGQSSIKFHREYSGKTCPGTSVIKNELISEAIKGTSIIPTKSLIKLGSRGNDVKILQYNLNKLGFNVGSEDGIAGKNTIFGIKSFQELAGLVQDGIFGKNSYKALDKLLAKKDVKRKSELITIGDAKIIKTLPDNAYIGLLGNTLHQAGVYGINLQFFPLGADVKDPKNIWGIATNDGKALGGNSMLVDYKGTKRGTIIFFEDGSLGMAKVNSINEFWKPHLWSVSGFTVFPYMDFKNEGMPSNVHYRTAHTYLGYDDEGYIYMIVKPDHLIPEIVPLLRKLKVTKCIALDGGGSSQLNHLDGYIRSNRKVGTVMSIKEV